MMQKILLIIFSIVLGNSILSAQNINVQPLSQDKIVSENIYVHLNTSTLLVGEYLLFKIYCTESNHSQLSSISKVAYVELIDSDRNSVLSQTVDLNNGLGTSDFFLPTSLKSGNYKLIAYTNWMRNKTENKFYQQDIFIINPYTSKQNIVTSDSSSITSKIFPSGSTSAIQLDQSAFGTREKVHANIETLQAGNYSISVRLLDSIPGPELKDATENFNSGSNGQISKSGIKYLPEMRGKLISGVINSQKQDNSKVKDVALALSVPGEDYFFRLGNTNEEGRFYFNIDENFSDEEVVAQVLGGEKDNFEIKFDKYESPNTDDLNFKDYKISSSFEKAILRRSVDNQIENAYFSLKPDTIKAADRNNLFKGLHPVIYNLDDYTRFKTVPETFVEIIPTARVRRRNDQLEFAVLGKEPYNDFKGSPLVIVDGLLLQDEDDFIRNFDSNRIQSVQIIRDKYFLGSKYFKGAILIETINNDFADSYNREYLKKIKINSGSYSKQYFKQDYSDKSAYSKIPDRRVQLLWNPNLDATKGKIEFYTSDVSGLFEIVIQGISDTGRPISLKQTFTVK